MRPSVARLDLRSVKGVAFTSGEMLRGSADGNHEYGWMKKIQKIELKQWSFLPDSLSQPTPPPTYRYSSSTRSKGHTHPNGRNRLQNLGEHAPRHLVAIGVRGTEVCLVLSPVVFSH